MAWYILLYTVAKSEPFIKQQRIRLPQGLERRRGCEGSVHIEDDKGSLVLQNGNISQQSDLFPSAVCSHLRITLPSVHQLSMTTQKSAAIDSTTNKHDRTAMQTKENSTFD